VLTTNEELEWDDDEWSDSEQEPVELDFVDNLT
jgi:hypothetical protein